MKSNIIITHFFIPKNNHKVIAAEQDGENFKNSVTGEYLSDGEIFPKNNEDNQSNLITLMKHLST